MRDERRAETDALREVWLDQEAREFSVRRSAWESARIDALRVQFMASEHACTHDSMCDDCASYEHDAPSSEAGAVSVT